MPMNPAHGKQNWKHFRTFESSSDCHDAISLSWKKEAEVFTTPGAYEDQLNADFKLQMM